MTQAGGPPLIAEFNNGSFGLVSTSPAYASNVAYFERVPPLIVETPMAIDANGFIYGGADHGLAIDDVTDLVQFGADAQYPVFAIIAQPDEGPVSGGTPVTIQTSTFSSSPDIYFGSQLSTASGLKGLVAQAVSPSTSEPQVTNIKIVEPNGVKAIMPAAFTYGGIVLPTYDWAVPPSGEVSIDVFGYGLGADDQSTLVRVAGQSSALSRAALYPAEQPYPFPLQHLTVQPPPGTPGPADFTISSSAGTARAQTRLHYLNSVQDFSFTGAGQYLLYDWQRERVYISAGDHIEVFSIGSSSFLQPIVPPTLHGKLELAGMALTPDASTLLVANNGDVSVAMIDVDGAAQSKVADVALQPGGPTQLAVTSNGKAFISFAVPGFTGGGGKLVELDLTTLQAALRNDSSLMFLQVAGNQLASSRDGTKVFLAAPGDDAGPLYVWDSSSDIWSSHSIGGFTVDAAAAADGNIYATTDTFGFNNARFVDPQLNIISSFSIPDFAKFQQSPIIGMRLHDTGALLYQPTLNGIEIYDNATGELREQISIREQVEQLARPLEVDTSGSRIFLLTNSGLTEVVLDSVPLSIGNLTPGMINAMGGTQLMIRGSGFQQGMTASFNGETVSTSIQNSNTAVLTTPALPVGPISVQLTNPDGTAYRLDAAVTAQ